MSHDHEPDRLAVPDDDGQRIFQHIPTPSIFALIREMQDEAGIKLRFNYETGQLVATLTEPQETHPT